MPGDRRKVKQLPQHEHVRARSDMYFGTRNADAPGTRRMGIDGSGAFCDANPDGAPFYQGVLSLLSEMVVNAFDAAAADRRSKHGKAARVEVECSGDGTVTVTNYGRGMRIRQPGLADPVPQMCFGSFFSGSNFDDDAERYGGGRNGVGAAVVNVMSDWFEVEVYHPRSRTLYTQRWGEGRAPLSERMCPPVVAKRDGLEGRVTVRCRLDLAYFGPGASLAGAHLRALRFRTACASHSTGVPASLNGLALPSDLCGLLPPAGAVVHGHRTKGKPSSPSLDVRWWAAAADGSPPARVALVNGVVCGAGTHVAHAEQGLWQAVRGHPEFASETANAGRAASLRRIGMLVSARVSNPQFASNAKARLVTPARDLGFRWELTGKALKAFHASDLMAGLAQDRRDRVAAAETRRRAEARREAKRGGGRRGLIGVADKLVDARTAGRKGNRAFLMVTEGDSAASLVHAGRPSLPPEVGPENCGSFVLRGKLLNVRNAAPAKVRANKEISGLVRALGLDPDREYESRKQVLRDLRYHGGVVVLSDQDTDGSHIAGLVCNALQVLFPSVCRLLPRFVRRFVTPVVIATPGGGAEPSCFFSLQDFRAWESEGSHRKAAVDYYKGLATSSDRQARRYFSRFREHILELGFGDGADASLTFAFGKGSMAERKRWLLERYEPGASIAYTPGGPTRVPLRRFIETDVAHFWREDNERSLPHLVDGLKEAQRKAVYALLTTYAREPKLVTIERMANRIAEVTRYHHGGRSMEETITRMAQDWVGAPFQNLPLLRRAAQFGTRWTPASVHGASRYLRSLPHALLPLLFPPADLPLLERARVDGAPCEPVRFVPVLPFLLVNGISGIGTGFSSSVPPHDPVALVDALLGSMAEDEPEDQDEDEGQLLDRLGRLDLEPAVHGFRGAVARVKGGFVFEGAAEASREEDGRAVVVAVTELPLTPVQTFLESVVKRHGRGAGAWAGLSNVDNRSGVHDVRILLEFEPGTALPEGREALLDMLGLRNAQAGRTSNMHAWADGGRLVRLECTSRVLREHAAARLALYRKRKERILLDIEARKEVLAQRVRFAGLVSSGEISFSPPKSRAELEAVLDGHEGLTRLGDGGSYAHLLGLSLSSLTAEAMAANRAKIEQMDAEAARRAATTARDMWRSELEELRRGLLEYRREKLERMRDDDQQQTGPGKGKKKRRKKALKPTR